jgi:RecG-like helicase
MPEFRAADLIGDMDILVEARDEAERWVRDDEARDRLMEALGRHGGAGLATVG